MDIKITYSDDDLYTVSVNGETILECLGECELQDITLGELSELYIASLEK